MIDDSLLVQDDFAPHLGSSFTVTSIDGAEMPMTLVAVERGLRTDWAGQKRDAFTLIFHCASDDVLPQGSYPFQHAAMGALEIFIGPIKRVDDGVHYAASFN